MHEQNHILYLSSYFAAITAIISSSFVFVNCMCHRFEIDCTNSVTLVFQEIWLVRYLGLMDNVYLPGGG